LQKFSAVAIRAQVWVARETSPIIAELTSVAIRAQVWVASR